MFKEISPEGLSKTEKYELILDQLKSMIENENDLIANLSNMMAILKYGMDFFWVGVYLVKGDELVLGPFQGAVACTRIKKGQGVCGTCWQDGKTIIVADVDQFPGHIACNSRSRSEIVVPIFDEQHDVRMVLDIDSTECAKFDEIDRGYLERVATFIEDLIAERFSH